MATQLSRKRRSRDNKLTELLWEPDDSYELTSEDISRGWFEHTLVHPRIVYRLLVRCKVNAGEYSHTSMIVNEDTGLVHVTLGGWETVDETIRFQYYYRFGGRLVPAEDPPSTIRLDVTNVNDWASTTYGDIWNDDSDATYATVNNSGTPDSRGWLESYTGGQIAGIRACVRASGHATTADVNDIPLVVELDRNHSGSRDIYFKGGGIAGQYPAWGPFKIELMVPADGVTRDYTLDVDDETLDANGWSLGQTGFDELQPDLETGNCQMYLWASGYFSQPPYPTGDIRIYEAWIEVTLA